MSFALWSLLFCMFNYSIVFIQKLHNLIIRKKRSTFLLLFVQTLHVFENAKNSTTNRNQKHSQKLVWLILRFVFTESTFSFASNFIQYGISFEQWIRKWPKFLLQLHTLTNFETTDLSSETNPDLDKYESLRPYRVESSLSDRPRAFFGSDRVRNLVGRLRTLLDIIMNPWGPPRLTSSDLFFFEFPQIEDNW